MATTWVDFKAVRAQVRFADVLAWYKVDVRSHGEQASAVCPLPGHEGDPKSRPFSANLVKGVFRCHKCQRQGNVLDFVTIMEGLDPERPSDVRDAALKLIERFGLHANLRSKQAKVDAMDTRRRQQSLPPAEIAPATRPRTSRRVAVNAELDFTLKDLDTRHRYLIDRGFTDDTIDSFGLGYCERGMLKDRIVIPLHDHQGRLIGYAGRLVDDDAVSGESPKYRFPGSRERNGVRFDFMKSLFVYNGHRIDGPVADLAVVEGFSGVWWLHQHGIDDVVAVMGASCSTEQAELIASLVTTDGRVWIVPDGDKAGDACALSLLSLVGGKRWVHWVQLDRETQPTDLVSEEIAALFPFSAHERSGAHKALHVESPAKKANV